MCIKEEEENGGAIFQLTISNLLVGWRDGGMEEDRMSEYHPEELVNVVARVADQATEDDEHVIHIQGTHYLCRCREIESVKSMSNTSR